jgi:hypothetical protein
MDRIEFIKQFAHSGPLWERSALVDALVACLSPEEACQCVGVTIRADDVLQRALKRKICRDIETHGFLPCHEELVGSWILRVNSSPLEIKRECVYWLSSVYRELPLGYKEAVLRSLLTSKYKTIRQRGYGILRSDWSDEHTDLLKQAWEKDHDELCAALIVEKFPTEFLLDQIDGLEKALSLPYRLAKLFIRIGVVQPDLLSRLAEIDEITFAYVLVRLRMKLTAEQALEIFERNKGDQRIGLLLWCLGQMGLWAVLENICKRSDQFPYLNLPVGHIL